MKLLPEKNYSKEIFSQRLSDIFRRQTVFFFFSKAQEKTNYEISLIRKNTVNKTTSSDH